MSQYPAVVSLADLGGRGMEFAGVDLSEGLSSVTGAIGDVNGDGFDDFMIASANAEQVYVVFGGRNLPETMTRDDLDGLNGFMVKTDHIRDGAGDFNGDGIDDLMFGGAPGVNSYPSHTDVLFGRSDFEARMSLPEADGPDGPDGQVVSHGGYRIAHLGDVDGDGFDDIGSSYRAVWGGDGWPYYSGGEVVLTFGHADGAAERSVVFFDNSEYGGTGLESVMSGGDFNGDGFADLIVAGRKGDNYLVFGGEGLQNLDITDITSDQGFAIQGLPYFNYVRAAGDINGDGYGDLRVGNTFLLGHGGRGETIDAGHLDGFNGFQVTGAHGLVLNPADVVGDFNGDGYDDLVFSDAGADDGGTDSGAIYVVFGRAKRFPPSFSVSELNGKNGFEITGADASDRAGAVKSPGDINGDGLDDLLIGAPGVDAGITNTGAVFVFYGIESQSAVHLVGTIASQTLVGSDLRDSLEGMGGDDVLWGHEGKDVLSGGSGEDLLRGGEGKDKLLGGEGDDTLIGGGERDRLEGGAGADTFGFDSIGSSTVQARDLILDLTAEDIIDLSHIDADTTKAGDQAFHLVSKFGRHAGEMTLTWNKAADLTQLQADIDGDGRADFAIDIAGRHATFTGFVL